MNDELAEPTEPEPDPAPASAPASPNRHTIAVDPCLAAAAAAVVLVLLSGAVGFAIGRSTADHGSDMRFPADGFSHGWVGPSGGSRNPGWGERAGLTPGVDLRCHRRTRVQHLNARRPRQRRVRQCGRSIGCQVIATNAGA